MNIEDISDEDLLKEFDKRNLIDSVESKIMFDELENRCFDFLKEASDFDIYEEFDKRYLDHPVTEISDFSTNELEEELAERGANVGSNEEIVWSIYYKMRLGKDIQAELNELVSNVTGKIVV